jgi:hypothetical protein
MATKPKSNPQQTAVVVPESRGTSLALPPEWVKELAVLAKEVSAVETPSVASVSFKSGVLSVGGTPMPGNTMTMIAIDTAFERALYEGAFDPNNPKSPVCFAITKEGDDPAPHENSLYPQHATCNGCPMNEWGSAGEGRRGKACKELRRVALIPADKLESVDDIKNSELAMARVPVTSVRNWSNYVHKVAATLNRPFWAVITRLTLKPHIKNQFEVLFDLEDGIEDIDALQALKQKRAHVEAFVMAPYSKAQETPEGQGTAAPPPPRQPRPEVKRKF